MTIHTLYRSRKYSPGNNVILSLILIVLTVIVFLPITWVYHNTEHILGLEFAQISLTFATILFMAMILTGMGLAHFISNAIRRRNFIFRAPKPGSWAVALIKGWGFELIEESQEKHETSMPDRIFELDQVSAILNKPRRRGRRPTYTLDRWRRIALKWENRDTLRDTMTLVDLLAEEFGSHPDGSPKITVATYYCWRDKVLEEARNTNDSKSTSIKISRDSR